jgi:hypothetical protein
MVTALTKSYAKRLILKHCANTLRLVIPVSYGTAHMGLAQIFLTGALLVISVASLGVTSLDDLWNRQTGRLHSKGKHILMQKYDI